ncbi:unnamed protein product [Camellia sinensis]
MSISFVGVATSSGGSTPALPSKENKAINLEVSLSPALITPFWSSNVKKLKHFVGFP